MTFNQRVMRSSRIQDTIARVAELVDAQDLKSCEIQPSCRFKSGLRHHYDNYSLRCDEFFYKFIVNKIKTVDIMEFVML